MKNLKLKHILFFAFIVRLIIFFVFKPWETAVVQKNILVWDSLQYHTLAIGIKEHFSFLGDAFRTPGYPFFISIIYKIFGNNPYVVLFFQIFINLFSIAMMHKIGKYLFNERVGLIAALLFSLDIHLTLYTQYLLTETLYIAMFLSAFYFLVKGFKEEKTKFFIIASLIYGCTSLIRPVTQFYIIGIVLFLFLWYKFNFKKIAKVGFIIVFGYFLVIAPWCFRNYKMYDSFSISNIKGYNLLFWDASYYMAKKQGISIDSVNANFITELQKMGWQRNQNPFIKEKYDRELALKILKPNFADYMKLHILGTVKIHLSLGLQSITDVLHLPSHKFTEEEKYGNTIPELAKKFFTQKTNYEIFFGTYVILFLAIIYFFMIYGTIISIQNKNILILLFCLGTGFYFAILSGIISYARYRLPFIPYYIFIASIGIDAFLYKTKKQ